MQGLTGGGSAERRQVKRLTDLLRGLHQPRHGYAAPGDFHRFSLLYRIQQGLELGFGLGHTQPAYGCAPHLVI